MSALHFVCPIYQRPFAPDFQADADTVRRHRYKPVTLRCPWCERTHRFMLADGTRQIPQSTEQTASSPPTGRTIG